jgi:hypothetical protein
MSQDEAYKCSMCYTTFMADKNDYICNDCLETTIILWKCVRCTNFWSPDYCNEDMYSDCCLAMIEGCNVDINSIKYCDKTGETIFPDDTACRSCTNNNVKCENMIKAYNCSECKLKDYC